MPLDAIVADDSFKDVLASQRREANLVRSGDGTPSKERSFFIADPQTANCGGGTYGKPRKFWRLLNLP